jgi:hypothetical protein
MSAFIESIRLRPLDTGDLTMAHWLGGAGLLMMGLGRCGVGNFGFSLGVNLLAERIPARRSSARPPAWRHNPARHGYLTLYERS